MDAVAVIDDPVTAGVSLDPIRARLLAELVEPGSASSLAPVVGLSRQKVNYHLRALESHGLVTLVEERRKGNMTERVLRATAAAYVISPAALPGVAPDPERSPDQLSAYWLLSVFSRSVGEIGELLHRSSQAGRPLATFAVDASIDFATAGDRASFAAELSDAVEGLVAKYHRAEIPGGRRHRLVVGLHPQITGPRAGVSADRSASDEGPDPTESTSI